MDGFFFIKKPSGPSSFAIIDRCKPFVGRERIGHAGTLDPAASGLLIVAVGKATRLLEYMPAHPKAYTFTVHFGSETDSLDDEGTEIKSGGRVPDRRELESVLPQFIGTISQEPPRFSAIKIAGERAYVRARRNESFAVASREVTVDSLTLESFDGAGATAVISARCSAGTYIRSLARDIAKALGTYGFASNIRRTAIGPFSLDDANEVDAVIAGVASCLVPIRDVFRSCVCATISETQKKTLSFGADVRLESLESGPECGGEEQPVFAFDAKDEIVAVLVKKGNGVFHPVKVFL